MMLGFILAFFLGIIPGVIAQGKGHNFFPWYLYGVALFIVALPHSLVLKPDPKEQDRRQIDAGGKRCAHCAEIIRREAKVCRFCGRDVALEDAIVPVSPAWSSLPTDQLVATPSPPAPPSRAGVVIICLLGGLILVGVLSVIIAGTSQSSAPAAMVAPTSGPLTTYQVALTHASRGGGYVQVSIRNLAEYALPKVIIGCRRIGALTATVAIGDLQPNANVDRLLMVKGRGAVLCEATYGDLTPSVTG